MIKDMFVIFTSEKGKRVIPINDAVCTQLYNLLKNTMKIEEMNLNIFMDGKGNKND